MVKFYTGCVMSGKTKLLIEFLSYSDRNKYIVLGPDMVFQNHIQKVKTRYPGYKTYDFDMMVSPSTDIISYIKNLPNFKDLKVIYCEEIQFWDETLIDQLFKIEKDFKIEVRCFGICKSHKNETWKAIKYLKKQGCDITTIYSKCAFCDMAGNTTIRYDFNLEAEELDPINDNGQEKYLGCCESCHSKKIAEKKLKDSGFINKENIREE